MRVGFGRSMPKKKGFLRRVPKKKIKEKGRVERNSEIRVEN